VRITEIDVQGVFITENKLDYWKVMEMVGYF